MSIGGVARSGLFLFVGSVVTAVPAYTVLVSHLDSQREASRWHSEFHLQFEFACLMVRHIRSANWSSTVSRSRFRLQEYQKSKNPFLVVFCIHCDVLPAVSSLHLGCGLAWRDHLAIRQHNADFGGVHDSAELFRDV